jgi:hypothetical protein
MVGKLHPSPRRSLTRVDLRRKKLLIKARYTTIKNSSDQSRGDDGYWPALIHGGADRGDGRYNTLEGGWKWSELLYMTKKLKKEICWPSSHPQWPWVAEPPPKAKLKKKKKKKTRWSLATQHLGGWLEVAGVAVYDQKTKKRNSLAL